jgi:hypothetical protein
LILKAAMASFIFVSASLSVLRPNSRALEDIIMKQAGARYGPFFAFNHHSLSLSLLHNAQDHHPTNTS